MALLVSKCNYTLSSALDLITGFPSLIDSVVDSDAELSSQRPWLLNKKGAFCAVGFDNFVLPRLEKNFMFMSSVDLTYQI